MTNKKGCGIVADMVENVRQVRVLHDVRDQAGKTIRAGEIVMAAFHPQPEKAKGLCYPLYYTGVRLYPTEYEIVITEKEWESLLNQEEDGRARSNA